MEPECPARLDRADEQFKAHDAKSQRNATLVALHAVVEFLCTSAFNGRAGRFSRPLALLWAELKDKSLGDGNRILPPDGSGSAGINGRISDHHVKAAAAFAVEFLRQHGGMTVDAAAGNVARILEAHQFAFGARRGDKPASVKAWRYDFRRAREDGPAARTYRKFVAEPPVALTGNAGTDGAAIVAWLDVEVRGAGYGSTA